MNIQLIALVSAPITAILAILYGAFLVRTVLSEDEGSEKMRQIGKAIREGAMAYLSSQFKIASIFTLILAVVTAVFLGIGVAIAFLLGAFFSALAGFIGMWVAVRANVRTANNCQKGLNAALQTAFKAGTVNGMLIVGLGLFGVSLIYATSYFLKIGEGAEAVNILATNVLVGFGFGACLLALFMRVGGGIFTKAADVGADLVGKVEKGIPEDDPRNPAVIADQVGDNVGDCAGMGADVFESYAVTIVAAMILGGSLFGLPGVVFPLIARSGAILTSIFGTFFVKAHEGENPIQPLFKGFIISAVSAIVVFMLLSVWLLNEPRAGLAAVSGLIAMLAILYITKYYTGPGEKPMIDIAKASTTGAGTNIIAGLSIGLESTLPSVLVVCGAIFAGYSLMGFYGIALAGMGMLATTGIIMSLDTYGPISDNAQGIAEMSGIAEGKAGKIAASLDAVGNTTKALTKGFAIASAAVAALSLFATYFEKTNLTTVNIADPKVFIGLLLGAMLPFFFSSRLMMAVGRSASLIVEEVRRQWKNSSGIMSGKVLPDYARVVSIATRGAQKELIFPAGLAVFSPLAVSTLGAGALGGFLGGVIVSALVLALLMCNTGGAWDNSKKYIEDGNFGGKGSDAHKAAVVGDTVGDPLKDTAGPALNPMIKIINIVALLIAPIIIILFGK